MTLRDISEKYTASIGRVYRAGELTLFPC
jgi:hypothetical protein